MPPIGAGVYGGAGNMTLGLTGMAAPQLPAGFTDQAGQPSASAGDFLRLGGCNGAGVGGASQFDHLMASSSGSSMFRSQGSSSSSFYLANAAHHAPAQDFPEDGQSQAGQGSLLHGKPAAFHDLMQLPVQHQQSSNGNLLNLGFFSGSNGVDQFNGGAGNGGGINGGQGSIVTSSGLAGNHLGGGGFPSLYNSSEPAGTLPQMSATALLQKAAQMGATTSSYNASGGGASSLLSGASSHGISSGEGPTNERSYQNLMIMGSMASGGGAGVAGSFSGASGFGGAVDDGKLSTRDFLVVGVVQGMSGSAAMGRRVMAQPASTSRLTGPGKHELKWSPQSSVGLVTRPPPPDPDAEVIALSPRTLMATNRFVCEVCNKGFQREQNLQLHRRGHNLPWKLKQKNPKEARRRVYLCPEPSCVHHDPSRALGDLTGIKKHYCRKHGEKKWRCDKCSKRYAVQSDWKAHSKTCGTREYRCDCGTLFSRRDSFITHRAFCDALAQENARMPPIGAGVYGGAGNMTLGLTGMAAPQLPAGFTDQAGQPSASAGDVLRLAGGNGAGIKISQETAGKWVSFDVKSSCEGLNPD
uniref:Protein EARLY HEADING DATE 2 n=1 Tax=Oryza punctata TaxID=4537 RepID=A0A0E0M4D1_ORYPU